MDLIYEDQDIFSATVSDEMGKYLANLPTEQIGQGWRVKSEDP